MIDIRGMLTRKAVKTKRRDDAVITIQRMVRGWFVFHVNTTCIILL